MDTQASVHVIHGIKQDIESAGTGRQLYCTVGDDVHARSDDIDVRSDDIDIRSDDVNIRNGTSSTQRLID